MYKNKCCVWIVLVALALIFHSTIKAQENKKIIAFVYDAGETFAFMPVYKKASRNYNLRLIPLTPWSLRLLTENNITSRSPKNLTQMNHIKSRYNSSNIDYWKKILFREKPDLVLLGMVSHIQEQLVRYCQKQKIKTIGYYDSFDIPAEKSIIWQFIPVIDAIFVPTRDIAKVLKRHKKEIYIVGQPSIDNWVAIAKNTNKQNIRQKLSVANNRKIVLFAGQYGKEYEKVFLDFIATIDKYKQFAIIIALHPKVAGRFEKGVIHSKKIPHISFTPKKITTATATVAADVVITWTSTVGIQATCIGKPVIYYGLKPANYSNNLIRQNLAYYATTKTFDSLLKKALQRNIHKHTLVRKLAKAGYFLEATNNIDRHLQLLLSKN